MNFRYFLATFITFLGACSTQPVPVQPSGLEVSHDCTDGLFNGSKERGFEEHVIRINRDGLLISQVKPSRSDSDINELLDQTKADSMYKNIFCEAENFARHRSNSDSETVVKFLVYVHGGLNNFDSTEERIVERQLPRKIMDESHEDNWHYPVFVSWPSGPVSTYFEQSFLIREGRKVNPAIGLASSPFAIGADIFRSVGNYPATAYYQLSTEKDRFSSAYNSSWLSQAWKDAVMRFCNVERTNRTLQAPKDCETNTLPPDRYTVKANLSGYYVTPYERFWRGLGQTVTVPFRYTLFSLWHSGISESAWDNMKRRTQNIFSPPYDFHTDKTEGVAGGSFFEALLDRADEVQDNSSMRYQITLVGHSMGAIVLNTALERHQAQWANSGALKNIVYMGAAASIGDTLGSLAPLLTDATENEKPINFYNLTLNRVAEVSETHGWGVVPLGSLLVSIDQHYENPEHPLRRTIGSEVNVLSSIDVIERRLQGLEGDVVFKAFDRCTGYAPSEHGDFGNMAFWREAAWSAENTSCAQRNSISERQRN
ncbi:lipase/acyltransferase domain-containing protein [Marinimicrobium locisalis]|uniref:lipase/acyltransferase domain-containing protein n=1 Tax=Marinimicrobium locisalis TaxID=546022 RepID=UPI0032215AEB